MHRIQRDKKFFRPHEEHVRDLSSQIPSRLRPLLSPYALSHWETFSWHRNLSGSKLYRTVQK